MLADPLVNLSAEGRFQGAPALFHEPWGGPHGGLAFGAGLLLVAAGVGGLTTSSRGSLRAAVDP